MFQFPGFPPRALWIQARVTPHDGCRVSPFGHPRSNALSAAPRGFSQPDTSFIGAQRQGIHRWLFVAWKNNFSHHFARRRSDQRKDARARYAILKELESGARTAKDAGSRAGVDAGGSAPRERKRRWPAQVRPIERERTFDRSVSSCDGASAPTGSRCAVGSTP